MKVIVKDLSATWKYATLYPIADVHLGAKECMLEEFTKYINQINDDDRAIVILAGDLINNGIKSSKTNVYDEVMPPDEQKYKMVELLRPIKDKIICMVGGNHERRTDKDTNIDITKDIAILLDIEDTYSKDMGFIKIRLGNDSHNKVIAYMLCVAHGAGGGSFIGSGLNKIESYQYTIDGVDIIITGHTHKPIKAPAARLIFDPRNNNIIETKTLMFVCTSWLRYGGYALEKLLKPVAFAPDTIRLDGTIKKWS